MKILVVGGGGREHAIIWRLANNPLGETHKLYCAPGNAGIARLAECIPVSATDVPGLVAAAISRGIEYTIIGMDGSLALGVVDAFQAAGLRVFGPAKEAAKLEWSKSYAKAFMKRHGIPTAEYVEFDNFDEARSHINSGVSYPLAVKADGLSAGKGVYICQTLAEAETALRDLMIGKRFGGAGVRVIVEEFLEGPETTVMAFCDGKTLAVMESAMDHKSAYDGGMGPNTGGMGVVSPSPAYTEEIAEQCRKSIFEPTIQGIVADGVDFRGVIYFGLMFTKKGPYVLEYNARMGDPEAQAVLPRLNTDLLSVCKACEMVGLDKIDIKWDNKWSACIILASGGYPGAFVTGGVIKGLDDISEKDALVFHAGTKAENGGFVTNGGRVLGITAFGENREAAVAKAYDAVNRINFEGMRYRTDIGRAKP